MNPEATSPSSPPKTLHLIKMKIIIRRRRNYDEFVKTNKALKNCERKILCKKRILPAFAILITGANFRCSKVQRGEGTKYNCQVPGACFGQKKNWKSAFFVKVSRTCIDVETYFMKTASGNDGNEMLMEVMEILTSSNHTKIKYDIIVFKSIVSIILV